MNYIGSKFKLSSFIKDTICSIVGQNLSDKIFCDLFAGTGIIGRIFKKDVKKVISNDIEYYSYVLNKNYIENHRYFDVSNLLDMLNNLPLIEDGFIYKNYCLGSGSNRQYFTDENGQKIDAIRRQIEVWFKNKIINGNVYYSLLVSLIESADKVANTASVYGAFLKNIKKTAAKKIFLEPALFEINDNSHEVYNEDSNKLIKQISGDILYLDPPYNERQYGANYHLLNTVAKYDNFIPKGKTGLRKYFRSNYCTKNNVLKSFQDIIEDAKFKYIFLSYNNEGLMSLDDIKSVMKRYGKYNVVKCKYQRFKSDKTENRNHKAFFTYEYLHILDKKYNHFQ
ncbi:MAG: DNA adenine methylase [Elusimicrobiota bacterium]|jgi:adenine-specific DNA-methyltransferase|nr:DNA adenine methylase [Elusimicrobiota bacterium]